MTRIGIESCARKTPPGGRSLNLAPEANLIRATARPRRSRGFSLVELLVVIGIIGILIAILLPAFSRARASAKSIACQSNLRQIYSASLLFAGDHHGYMQLAGNMNGVSTATPDGLGDADSLKYVYYDDAGTRRPLPFEVALAKYFGENIRTDSPAHILEDWDNPAAGSARRVFTCPAQETAIPVIAISSVAESWYAPLVSSSYGYNEGLLGYIENSKRWMRGHFNDLRSVERAVVYTDALPRTEFGTFAGTGYVAWMPHADGVVTLSDAYTNCDDTFSAGVRSQFDLLRDQRKINIVYADGHVAALRIDIEELKQAVLLPN
jgi:prepilin-type N-terminal cleavage/methylation domain-containing protein/prepilin-type processing-associated H-X9-DG protein